MSNLIKRILLFVLGMPLLTCAIVFLPFLNHLLFNLILTAAAVLATLEAGTILFRRALPCLRYAAAGATGILCIFTYFITAGFFRLREGIAVQTLILFTGGAILLFSLTVIRRMKKKDLSPSIRSIAGVFLFLYPGLFFMYLIKLSGLGYSTLRLLFFISAVYMSNALAYITGSIFGKKERIVVKVSPNKSLIGFITEIIFCSAITIVLCVLFPTFFPLTPVQAAFLGIGLGITSIAGDLFESALKRTAGVKDSGRLIPGRGGILDSVDSLLLSAPLVYFVFTGM